VAVVGLRWEWRTFGDDLGEAAQRLASLRVEQVTESDETYLLAPASLDAVKVRDGLLDVKHLEEVDDDGLQLWAPVMKAPLPVSAADTRAVLAALDVPVPALEGGTFVLSEIVAAGAGVTAVPVHKTRRHVKLGGCKAELTDLRTGGRSVRTIAVESEDPARVIAAVHELGLALRPNISVPRGLEALLDRAGRGALRTNGARTAHR
jgi:exopolyphosphatase / guanosine-5'-triphosphate,3'-diphosphate pyrophosphatase